MQWTGLVDKALFKLLTLTGDQVLAAGNKTASFMPRLEGRDVVPLSRSGISLRQFHSKHPLGTLIGGQTVAIEALKDGLLHEIILMQLDRYAFAGQRDELHPLLDARWKCHEVRILDVRVEIWQPNLPAVLPLFPRL
jgi:hypothetical protein